MKCNVIHTLCHLYKVSKHAKQYYVLFMCITYYLEKKEVACTHLHKCKHAKLRIVFFLGRSLKEEE